MIFSISIFYLKNSRCNQLVREYNDGSVLSEGWLNCVERYFASLLNRPEMEFQGGFAAKRTSLIPFRFLIATDETIKPPEQ
jgi:hypothetical protein